jgi:hypothetical protein
LTASQYQSVLHANERHHNPDDKRIPGLLLPKVHSYFTCKLTAQKIVANKQLINDLLHIKNNSAFPGRTRKSLFIISHNNSTLLQPGVLLISDVTAQGSTI